MHPLDEEAEEVKSQCNAEAKMASFLRGKQAGVQRDFSAALDAQLFAIDEVGPDRSCSCPA